MGWASRWFLLGAWVGLSAIASGCGGGGGPGFVPTAAGALTSSTTGGATSGATGSASTPAGNQPPTVSVVTTGPTDVGANSWILLQAAATDDGLPGATLSYRWTQVRGPGTATFGDASGLVTTVAFDARGEYVLRVVVSDGAEVASADVTVRSTDVAALPAYSAVDPFLARFENDEQDALAYYATIDPNRERETLAGWRTVNGFDAGGPDTRASYYNAGDLRFGRQMILKRTANGVAFATINHANVDDAVRDRDRIATVAMEYSPGPNGGAPFTKFYVYDANDRRITGADLDGGGFRYVPSLCIACHGGSAGKVTNGVYSNGGDVGATFLPFDGDAFEYSRQRGFTRADLQDELHDMNAGVLATNPPAATRELIEGWYGGPGLPNTVQDTAFVPTGWVGSGKEDLYRDVVARSCRTCHVAVEPPLELRTASGFMAVASKSLVEMRAGRMPHARVTYENFWQSEQPGKLVTATGLGIAPMELVLSAAAVEVERRIDGEPQDIGGVRGNVFEMGGLLGDDAVRLRAEAVAAETSATMLRDRLRQANVDRRVIDELDRRRDNLARQRRQLEDQINAKVDFGAAQREFARDVRRQSRDALRQLSSRSRRGLADEIQQQIQAVRDLVGGRRIDRDLRQMRDVRDALKELRQPLIDPP